MSFCPARSRKAGKKEVEAHRERRNWIRRKQQGRQGFFEHDQQLGSFANGEIPICKWLAPGINGFQGPKRGLAPAGTGVNVPHGGAPRGSGVKSDLTTSRR